MSTDGEYGQRAEYETEGSASDAPADSASNPVLRTTFVREATIRYRGRRRKLPDQVRRADQVVSLAKGVVGDEAREHFVALYLDGRHRPIAHSVVSVGTATASLVHPREVFQAAVLTGAHACIVSHNHPSGDPEPSSEDREVTRRLSEAGQILGIRLVDSIVWCHGHDRYISLRETEPEAFGKADSLIRTKSHVVQQLG